MTPTTDSPQPANETAAPTSELIRSVETALMQGEVFRRGIWALNNRDIPEDGMIEAGKVAFAALLTSLQQAERENALLTRDLNELRTAYNLQAEGVNLLTLEEQRILRCVRDGKEPDMSYGMWCHMTSKQLISSNEERDTHWLTEYGEKLLAELAEGGKAK